MLTTSVFELVQQLYRAIEIANVANGVSACADQPWQTRSRQLFPIRWTIAEHNLTHA